MTDPFYIIHKIVCDETNNTQEDIDNGTANIDTHAVKVVPLNKLTVDLIVEK
jgi:hypothetical protein